MKQEEADTSAIVKKSKGLEISLKLRRALASDK